MFLLTKLLPVTVLFSSWISEYEYSLFLFSAIMAKI